MCGKEGIWADLGNVVSMSRCSLMLCLKGKGRDKWLLHSWEWVKSFPWEGKMKLALVFLRVQKGVKVQRWEGLTIYDTRETFCQKVLSAGTSCSAA